MNIRPRVVAIIQVRMGATRLPGKPLKTVLGRPLISYQIERLRRCAQLDQLIVATTTNARDQPIVDFCQEEGIGVFRGSEDDVLDRYLQAARAFHADVVVRVTGDCPLIDPQEVDRVVQFFLSHQYTYVSNSLKRTFPRGLDVEVFSFQSLESMADEAKSPAEREHVTPYFYEHPERFSLGSVESPVNLAHHRWTVDTDEDFQLVSRIIAALYPQDSAFTTQDILHLLDKHPDWVALNAHIKQKPLRPD